MDKVIIALVMMTALQGCPSAEEISHREAVKLSLVGGLIPVKFDKDSAYTWELRGPSGPKFDVSEIVGPKLTAEEFRKLRWEIEEQLKGMESFLDRTASSKDSSEFFMAGQLLGLLHLSRDP